MTEDLLRQAAARLQANDSAGALAVLRDAGDAPAALRLRGMALAGLGRIEEALATFGRGGGDPQVADAHARLLRHLAGEYPDVARFWAELGMVEQQRGDSDAAEAALARAIALEPRDLASRHNRAAALRASDRTAEALAQSDDALTAGLTAPEAHALRGHLLAELGRFDEAFAQYRAVLAEHPGYLDVHATLARLVPQATPDADPLADYRLALARMPDSRPLWLSAIEAAKALRNPAQQLEWAEAAIGALGPDPILATARANALATLGELPAARDLLRAMAADHPRDPGIHANLAHVLIASGDPKAAEASALAAAGLAPTDQTGWALLTVIWRLLDDPRERWLADYDRLVMPIDIPEPPDRAELAAALEAMHDTVAAPADQTLRGGTQTRGDLFTRRIPVVQALVDSIRRGVEARLAELPDDSSHPFLVRNTNRIAFRGGWSVRLASAGFHISHIHPSGWLSSAFYVTLPGEVAGNAGQGALAFGVPDASLGLDLSPRRVVAAEEGRLVVFPSYFWHGTLPFESAAPRLTVAFDALPVDFAGAAL